MDTDRYRECRRRLKFVDVVLADVIAIVSEDGTLEQKLELRALLRLAITHLDNSNPDLRDANTPDD